MSCEQCERLAMCVVTTGTVGDPMDKVLVTKILWDIGDLPVRGFNSGANLCAEHTDRLLKGLRETLA